MASYKKIKKIEDESAKVRVVERLLELRKQLSAQVPEKTATQTLLLATWNIREFGDNRLPESSYYIAEIIDHFDIVVIQEVNSKEIGGLESVLSILGDNWSYVMSDGVEGSAGGNEAMAFVYNTNKVKFTGLAGELVLPDSKLMSGVQFARTPFMVSFRAGWFDFKLCTVHIYYGKDTVKGIYQRRLKEIQTVSDFLLKRQQSDDVSYILLGDFNIPDTKGEYFNALVEERTKTKSGKEKSKEKFFIPEEIRRHPTDLGHVSHYDQIAFSLKLDRSMVLYDDDKQKAFPNRELLFVGFFRGMLSRHHYQKNDVGDKHRKQADGERTADDADIVIHRRGKRIDAREHLEACRDQYGNGYDDGKRKIALGYAYVDWDRANYGAYAEYHQQVENV